MKSAICSTFIEKRFVLGCISMVKWTVREVAEKMGLTSANQLRVQAGLHAETAYKLWDGSATRVDMETINKLCNLLKVPVGMLIEHVPDSRRR